jgi:2-(1,2-epoxy-1,2-dihydrophenyl)acetyl-CoA isomerase
MSDPYASIPGLEVQLDGPVLRLTLDRPDKRNALDDAMVAGLIAAIDAAGRDEQVRCIVLGGNGDHFCGGADIVARNAGSSPRAGDPGSTADAGGTADTGDAGRAGRAAAAAAADAAAAAAADADAADAGGAERAGRPRVGSIQRRLPAQAHRLIPLVLTVQVPVVCRVQGWAAGIGFQLALAADFTVAAADARFWEPFTERGFTPDSGATWLLPRRVGPVHARELLLLGRKLSGDEAVAWGAIHAAVPPDQLDRTVADVVEPLAGGPTVALGLTKWLLHQGEARALDDQLRDEAFALELSSRSEDFREGLQAFREKRRPGFKGR